VVAAVEAAESSHSTPLLVRLSSPCGTSTGHNRSMPASPSACPSASALGPLAPAGGLLTAAATELLELPRLTDRTVPRVAAALATALADS
jgi:hypothetical protein